MDHAQMSSLPQAPVAQDQPGSTTPEAIATPTPDSAIIRVHFENEVFDVEPAPIEEIRQTLAEHYPAARAAAVQEATTVIDGQTVRTVTFRKQVGTKGGGWRP